MTVRVTVSDLLPSITWLTTFAPSGAAAGTNVTGGVSTYARQLRDGLAETGVDLSVQAPCEEGLSERGVSRSWARDSLLAIARIVLRTRNLLHIQHEIFMYGGMVSALVLPMLIALRRLFRVGATVLTLHGVPSLEDVNADFLARNSLRGVPAILVRHTFRRIFRMLAMNAQWIIVHENVFARRLAEQYGVPVERVSVMPLPCIRYADAPPPDEARRELGLNSGAVFLFFGFVGQYKGVEQLMSAWERYVKHSPSDHLVIAGGMNPRKAEDAQYQYYYGSLKERAKNLEGITWFGFAPDETVPVLFAAADVLVLPYTELLGASGPLSVAALYGTKVLCSETLRPVAPEGACFSGLDPIDWSVAMVSSLTRPRPAGFEKWRAERTFESMARGHKDIYRSVGASENYGD